MARPPLLPCPTCRQPTPIEANPHRPFCSKRCKLSDLGGWMTESYRVAGDPVVIDDGATGDDEEKH